MKFARILLALVLTVILGWINLMLHSVNGSTYPQGAVGPDVVPGLHNIGRRLRAGEGAQMQAIFPEGWFFSNMLYGYAWVNVGLATQDPALKARAEIEARWALDQADTPAGRAPFQADTQVPNGVFYTGWMNRLLGGLLLLQLPERRDPALVARFHKQSEILAQAYLGHTIPWLDAYPGQAWPCDNAPALSSLVIHDALYGSTYRDTAVRRFIDFSRAHLDPATGLIPHQVRAGTGEIEIGARASTQVYLHAFLPEIDDAFAGEQYAKFRAMFAAPFLGFMPLLEYPAGTTGSGDVDTGPLILGYSMTGTGAGIAAARANRDQPLFVRNVILSELLGFPAAGAGEKQYLFGRLIVADAFLAWGKSMTPWTATAGMAEIADDTIWIGLWHAASVAVLGLVWMWAADKFHRPHSPKGATVRMPTRRMS